MATNQVQVVRTVAEFRAACDAVRAAGQRLGLVPTMGALHEGHASLMREARRRVDVVAVTIFVNPTQFGPNEDLARYPRDLEGDVALCQKEGVALVFAPGAEEMYPAGESTRVSVAGVSAELCGATRPGHFDGVSTIVTKLFAVAGPCVSVFGRKDYQQLAVIRRMTRDLMLPVELVGAPTVRESDGLALSSRNRFLSTEERQQALAIPRTLSALVARFVAGERSRSSLEAYVNRELEAAGLRVVYARLMDADSIAPLGERVPERALFAVAVMCGATRLIDNVELGVDPAPLRSVGGSS